MTRSKQYNSDSEKEYQKEIKLQMADAFKHMRSGHYTEAYLAAQTAKHIAMSIMDDAWNLEIEKNNKFISIKKGK